ncbi:MAG: TRAP transporter fused permease subunit [Pseudomonadota bacterium]
MAEDKSTAAARPDEAALDIAAEADTGGRSPGGVPEKILLGVALLWSLFQLWIASPIPFMVGTIDLGFVEIPTVLNDTQARSIHLAFAIFLAYLGFPALKRSPRDRIPVQDWVFAVVGALCAAYLFLFYESVSERPGAPILQDIIVACIGMVLLLEATRRSLGPPLTIVATVFLLYNFAGPFMPAIIAHKGNSLNEVVNHQWITTEGVFGIALGVSTSFVFLFVLFGAMLDKAGAGNYFIQLAFSLLGHLRGGPAKAAVVSSGMTGLISGSSIANVVTTGTFTIPLMKRVGFPAEKAGAIEVAASTNGQLTPPVMGAAAFLMIEYLGIPYIDVIKHAFLPAIISYIALVYIVHLEALKANMQGLPKPGETRPLVRRLMGILLGFIVVCAAAAIVYWGLGWMPSVFGDATPWIAAVIVVAVYVALVRYAAQVPDLELDDPNAPVVELPETKRVVRTGLHFILPIVVLVYCLMVLRLSPGLSAFWATVLMMFILVTQRPLLALFRGHGEMMEAWRRGFDEFIDGMISGARNMIGIGIATATAGIIVGVVSQTGVGSALAEVVEALSFGSVFIMLVWTAVLCIILPLGLVSLLAYALMSLLGIGLKVSTLPVVALGVGIGVDYGIYIYGRFKNFRDGGEQFQEAFRHTLQVTGSGVVFTGLTLAIGTGTWIFSPLQFQADMGILLTFMFLVNMLGAILLLPALASFLLGNQQAKTD